MFTIDRIQEDGAAWFVIRDDRGDIVTTGAGRLFEDYAKALASAHDERSWRRMVSVKAWLRKLGCCDRCAGGMAIARTERDEGRRFDWKALRGACMGVSCKACEACRDGRTCVVPRACEEIAAEHRDQCPPAPTPIVLNVGAGAELGNQGLEGGDNVRT